MEYQKFLCVVEKKMNQKLKGGITASIHIAVKNNGKIRKGIVVEDPCINISPTIYLEEFYERFQKGEALECIICELFEFYEAVKYEKPWDTSKVERYEEVRDKIAFKVIHTEENREMLKGIPHVNIMDLSVVFYVLLEMKKESTATMLIRNEHLDVWGLEENELFPLASKNIQKILPVRLFAMQEIMEEILNPDFQGARNMLDFPELFERKTQDEADMRSGVQDGEGKPDVMFVLTNSIRNFGAACLFYPGILDMVGNLFGEDFYILPSSIHELILVPCSNGLDKAEMESVVKEVNETQVAEEERLSGHVYFYERKRKNLCVL